MKKLVPDPPPVLCIRAGMSPEEAIYTADKHLKSALSSLNDLPEQALPMNRTRLTGAILNLKIGRTLLTIARTKSTACVPIE